MVQEGEREREIGGPLWVTIGSKRKEGKDEWKEGGTRKNRRIDGWKDEWKDGRAEGWIDGRVPHFLPPLRPGCGVSP